MMFHGERMCRIWCLRHGESQNVVDAVAGVVPAAPLTAEGRRQAESAAAGLKGISDVYASDAVRAVETAEIVAELWGARVTVLPGLREVGIGSSEGASDPVTRARMAEVLRSWVHGDLLERVGDGEDGHEVTGRVTAALAEVVEAHPGGTVALVGHVGSLTAALSVLCGLGGRVWGTPLPHAVPFLVEGDGYVWRCSAWPGL